MYINPFKVTYGTNEIKVFIGYVFMAPGRSITMPKALRRGSILICNKIDWDEMCICFHRVKRVWGTYLSPHHFYWLTWTAIWKIAWQDLFENIILNSGEPMWYPAMIYCYENAWSEELVCLLGKINWHFRFRWRVPVKLAMEVSFTVCLLV